ncbi:MAG: glycosyltransferase, partial [Planctomycetes bacterium]|nr:glycosyltransferase [Planctomycetota bacterium]
MNIILFIDADVFAGTERHILDLAVALTALDQNVTVACPVPAPLADRARAAGINVLAVAKKRMPDFAAIKILAAQLRSGQADLIHAHNGRTHLLAVAAVKRAGRGRVVATQHFLAPNRTGRRGPKAALANRLHRWAERNTAAFVAISNAVKDQMLARGDAPSEKITVVHNGTVEPESASAEKVAALRAELNVGDRPMIFCAARLQKEKDIPTLIKAFGELRTIADGDGAEFSPDAPGGEDGGGRRATENTENTENTEEGDGGLRVAGLAGQPAGCGFDGDDHHKDTTTRRDEGIHKEVAEGYGGSLIVTTGDEQRATDDTTQPGIHKEVGEGYGGSLMVTTGDEQRINDTTQPVLLIAGEGDQRPECERLIRSMNNDQGKKNNNDPRSLGNTDHCSSAIEDESVSSVEAPLQSVRAAFVSSCLGGEKPSAVKTSENLQPATCSPKSSAFCLPSSVFSSHCSMYLLGFRSDVSALMAACDIFVLPAPAEPFGLVLIEAMALGKPVIAAAAGGPLEIVADGETGL